MVGIGVIGVGYWGPNLIRNFAALGEVELVAIADQDTERLRRVGLQYPGVAKVERIEDLLADDRIHGIAVATPADTHYRLGKAVLKSRYSNLYKLLRDHISEGTYMGIVRNQILVDVQGDELRQPGQRRGEHARACEVWW